MERVGQLLIQFLQKKRLLQLYLFQQGDNQADRNVKTSDVWKYRMASTSNVYAFSTQDTFFQVAKKSLGFKRFFHNRRPLFGPFKFSRKVAQKLSLFGDPNTAYFAGVGFYVFQRFNRKVKVALCVHPAGERQAKQFHAVVCF